jgi:hypothetical protein
VSSPLGSGTWGQAFGATSTPAVPVAEADGDSRPGNDRLIELIAVLLLGVATVATAWCGFQSAQWSNRSNDLAQAGSTQHIEAARLFGAALQGISYDSSVVTAYAAAQSAGDTRLVDFYRTTLVRQDFLPVLRRWEQQVAAGQVPIKLTEDQAYLDQQLADYSKALTTANQSNQESQVAAQNAGEYLRLTIVLAMALFFAGVTSSFRHRLSRLLLVVASAVTLVLAFSQLIGLPLA